MTVQKRKGHLGDPKVQHFPPRAVTNLPPQQPELLTKLSKCTSVFMLSFSAQLANKK